jgi:hypothetical protein
MVRIFFLFYLVIFFHVCSSIEVVKEWWITRNGFAQSPPYVPLFIVFSRAMGDRYFDIQAASFYLEKPYKSLHIKELSFSRDGKKCYLIKDITKELGELYELKLDSGKSLYQRVDGSWFILGKLNQRRIFKKMKVGDGIKIELTQVYSFDDEPLQTQTFIITVACGKRSMELPSFMYLP